MPTNPPANPLLGAVYVDRVTNISYVFTGTYWLQAHGGSQNYNSQSTPTTSIIPGFYAEPTPDTWVPHVGATAPLNPGCGQIWVDTSTVPYSTSIWDCITATFIPLGGVPGGDTNSIVSTAAPSIRVSGDPLQSGDIWINPNTNAIAFWNGATWIQASTPDTHSIFSAAQPATRANGDALLAGDLWTDPDNGNIYYFDGASWQPVQAIDADHQLSTTTPTVRPNGDPLAVADLWTNTISNTLFYFDGVAWVRYNDTHSIQSATSPSIRPSGDALQGGDQWFDPVNNLLYVYDGTAPGWVLVTTNDTHSFLSAGVAPVIRPGGGALQSGDLYIDTVTRQGYYYNATTSTWVLFGSDTHSLTGVGDPVTANPVTSRPNGTALVAGDQYLNTATNLLYTWTGTTWAVISGDTHSFVSATALTTRPDGTPLQNGDQMYLTSTTPWTLKYWDTSLGMWMGEANQSLLRRTVNPVNGVDSAIFGTVWHNTVTLDSWEFVENPVSPGNGLWKQLIQEPTIQFASAAPTTQANGLPLIDGDIYYNTTNTLSFIYNLGATTWVPFGNDTHSFPQSVVPGTRPSGAALTLGDKWIDTDFSPAIEYYRSAANTWLPMGDVSTVTALPIAGEYDNQLLVNSTNNRLYRYDSTAVAWVQVA